MTCQCHVTHHYTVSMPNHQIYPVRCWRLAVGGKPKNLYFTGGIFKFFFHRGVNQKTPKWQGVKAI